MSEDSDNLKNSSTSAKINNMINMPKAGSGLVSETKIDSLQITPKIH